MRVVAAWLALVGLVASSVSVRRQRRSLAGSSTLHVSTGQEQASPKAATELEGNWHGSAGWDRERIESQVVVGSIQAKGRCLFAKKSFRADDVIFVEGPILVATPSMSPRIWKYLQRLSEEKEFEWNVEFYFAALMSLKLEQDKISLIEDKCTNKASLGVKEDVHRIVRYISSRRNTQLFLLSLSETQLLCIVDAWYANGWRHPTKNHGLVMYDRISMTSHSCNPTAYVHIDRRHDLHLKAYDDLKEDGEVTISYMCDAYEEKPHPVRQDYLRANFGFECCCPKCSQEANEERTTKKAQMELLPIKNLKTEFLAQPMGQTFTKEQAKGAKLLTQPKGQTFTKEQAKELIPRKECKYTSDMDERLQREEKREIKAALRELGYDSKPNLDASVLSNLSAKIFERTFTSRSLPRPSQKQLDLLGIGDFDSLRRIEEKAAELCFKRRRAAWDAWGLPAPKLDVRSFEARFWLRVRRRPARWHKDFPQWLGWLCDTRHHMARGEIRTGIMLKCEAYLEGHA